MPRSTCKKPFGHNGSSHSALLPPVLSVLPPFAFINLKGDPEQASLQEGHACMWMPQVPSTELNDFEPADHAERLHSDVNVQAGQVGRRMLKELVP